MKHAASVWTSLESVAARGAEGLTAEARVILPRTLRSLRQSDGGFSGLDGRSDPYFSFFAWLALRALGDRTVDEALCAYFAARRENVSQVDALCADLVRLTSGRMSRAVGWARLARLATSAGTDSFYGAFLAGLLSDVLVPSALSRVVARSVWRRVPALAWAHLPTPQAAAACLLAVRAEAAAPDVSEALKARHCAAGGFASAAGGSPDLLATAVARFALTETGDADTRRAWCGADLDFISSCWTDDGLFGASPAAASGDAEHTFYGLLALGTCRN